MKIVFATNNQHKLDEIRAILGPSFEVVSLADIGCHEDIPETGTTLEENALMKAQYVFNKYHLNCFADDTGLEVDALGGAPGVFSARYAAVKYVATKSQQTEQTEQTEQPASHDSEANMNCLLHELGNNNNRKARFRTVIALIEKEDGLDSIKQFEGIVNGEIIRERRGGEGFGYDPIFQPDGYDKTFAELGSDVKNQISHRARATQKLAEYLLKVILPFFIFFCSPLHAQIGTWKTYLAYQNVQQIQAAGDHIFVLASNGLYVYNKTDQSIVTYDKINGLSDTYITNIRWCQQAKQLIVVYGSSNIDLIDTNGNVTNISDIYLKAIIGDKTINNITIQDQYAYFSCGFGIVKMNVKKTEISESYMLGFPITAVVIANNSIYAQSKDNGVWTGSLDSNLIDKANWQKTDSYPSFEQDNSDYEQYYSLVSTLSPGGPKYNNMGYIKFLNGKLYTCNGSFNTTPSIQILNGNEWTVCQDEGISEITGVGYLGFVCFDVDPTSNDDHIFAGSRNGLYEFRNGKFVQFFNHKNSPIEPFDGKTQEYELTTGVQFDTNGTLWILNSQAPTQGLIKYADGQFSSISQPALMKLNDGGFKNKSNGDLSRMMVDSQGLMWFCNNHWMLSAFYQYDIQNNKVKAYENFINQDGTRIEVGGGIRCVVEDLDKNLWIGSSAGPFVLERSKMNDDDPVFTQIKVPRNDGTNYADYLLSGESVSCMVIDAAGRKWIGTNSDGVYLISSDNMTQLEHFTAENSKLLSNEIQSIAINNTTGEVFFGTYYGLCSYVSDATTTSEDMTEDNVHAYPNPVTPDYTGLITIVGLTLNADVKILSSNGALIAEGRSNGGSFTWDGCDKQGRRVASGIYMVATAKADGSKGTVCKIAIVR